MKRLWKNKAIYDKAIYDFIKNKQLTSWKGFQA